VSAPVGVVSLLILEKPRGKLNLKSGQVLRIEAKLTVLSLRKLLSMRPAPCPTTPAQENLHMTNALRILCRLGHRLRSLSFPRKASITSRGKH